MKTLKLLLPVFSLLLFTACDPFRHVTSVRIVYQPEAQFRPGASVPFGVVSLDKKGRRKYTKGYTQGKVSIDKYEVAVSGGWQDESNIVIDTIVEGGPSKTVVVHVRVPGHTRLHDSIIWPLTYEGEATWYFNGAAGSDGKRGKVRLAPVRLGGTALSDGNSGEGGSFGSAGHDLDIYVVKVSDSAFIASRGYTVFAVKVRDRQTGTDKLTYVQEKYGRLRIFAQGGKGGNGGEGGPGPDGRNTEAGKSPGNGSDGGAGGNGGEGGKGGKIRIYIDSVNRDFLNQLIISNEGGPGGLGGRGGIAGRGGRSSDGNQGRDGSAGLNGLNGNNGVNGGRAEIIFGPVSLN